VTGDFSGMPDQTEVLTAFFDLNNTAGVSRIGGRTDDLMSGGAGDDQINGGAGADLLLGNADNDLFYGGEGADTLNGGTGDDSLGGGQDDDRIVGGTGVDTYFGERGNDTLITTADGARNVFYYQDGLDGDDRTTGFVLGEDKIFLNFLSGGTMDSSRYVGSAGAMTDNGPYVIYIGATGLLSVDLNGTDAGESYVIATLTGRPALGFDDFIFGP
jgi:Ca2+-binding RTX toxin-like protein